MSVVEALKRRARFLLAGFVSVVAAVALLRWSSGEALSQPAADLGLLLGFGFVAAFYVMTDMNDRGADKQQAAPSRQVSRRRASTQRK
jgi:4-hydroxybenzoate polyprenyltransferase